MWQSQDPNTGGQTIQPTDPLYLPGYLSVHGPQSLQQTWEGRIETQTPQPIHEFKAGKPIISRIKWDMKTKFIILVQCIIFQL